MHQSNGTQAWTTPRAPEKCSSHSGCRPREPVSDSGTGRAATSHSEMGQGKSPPVPAPSPTFGQIQNLVLQPLCKSGLCAHPRAAGHPCPAEVIRRNPQAWQS